jgi:hypothetical protein
MFARPLSFDFYLCGHLKALMYLAPIENEETLHQRNILRLSYHLEPP